MHDVGTTTFYLETTGITSFAAIIDSGSTKIELSNYFLLQMSYDKWQLFGRTYNFNCSKYLEVMPTITFGFRNGPQEISISVPASKLYDRNKSNPQRCFSLLQELEFDGTHYERIAILGVPFFSSVYMEMKWKDTRNIQPSDWGQMDFDATVCDIDTKINAIYNCLN